MERLIFLSLCIVCAIAQQLTSDGCYMEFLNSKVVCMEPWEVCKNVANCQDCEAICTQYAGICQAVQYQQSTQECSLYRVPIKPSYGRKKRAPGCYGNAPPSLNKNSPDYTYYIVSNSSTCNSGQTQPPVVTYAPITTVVTYPPIVTQPPPPPVTDPPPPPVTDPPPPPVTNPPTPPTMPPVVSDSPIPPTQGPLPPQATCPAGQSAILVKIKGTQLAGSPESSFQASSEQDCMQACLANQQPSGVFSPCQSADFNTGTMQCNIFLSASPPTGTGQLTQAEAFTHYEKTCMDSSVVAACPGPIVKAPQKLLVGYAESIVTATSESDCMVQCLQAQQRFGFQCASGMFYTSEATSNCILNSESATTQPTLYTDETQDKVDYFEPFCTGNGVPASSKKGATPIRPPPQAVPKNGKRPRRDISSLKPTRKRSVIWPGKSDWGSWTRCDGQLSVRYHYRNCKSVNPNKCEVANEKCDPTNRVQEMQDIAAEETTGGAPGGDGDKGNGNGNGNDHREQNDKKGRDDDNRKREDEKRKREEEKRKREHENERDQRNKNKRP